MKNKRNCPMSYGMPNMPMMMPPVMVQPYSGQMPMYNDQTNNYDNNLVSRVNNLEKRVSALENMYNSNNYNSSNYQML